MYSCELFHHDYDAVVSLGNACATAENLKANGLVTISSPFDWIISQDTSQVIKQLCTRFASFFSVEHQYLAEDQRSGKHLVIVDKETNFVSMHDIPKETDDSLSAFKTLHAKFSHKIESFYRRISFCDKVLFVRRSDEATEQEMIELKQALDQSFADQEVHLLILKNNPDERIQEMENGIWVICSTFQYTGINPDIEWQGDYLAWRRVFSGIKTISSLERLERVLDERLNNRSVVIWGMRGNFREIESVLQKKGLKYYAYDKSLSTAFSHDRIFAKPIFLHDRSKYFVIVNTKSFR
jgi:hypothetical protein